MASKGKRETAAERKARIAAEQAAFELEDARPIDLADYGTASSSDGNLSAADAVNAVYGSGYRNTDADAWAELGITR